MSKTILFMRHGKAEELDNFNDDFERQLTERGKLDIADVAKRILAENIIPGIIITSPAIRTQQTAESIKKELGVQNELLIDMDLYCAPASDYLRAASKSKESVILIVGHNPEMARLAMHYSNGIIMEFPTSSCAAFVFDEDTIQPNSSAELLFYFLRN